MVRQVIIPTEEKSTISIPAEYYGREVEVLVFPHYGHTSNQDSASMRELFSRYLFSFEGYTFNRDEANDYE